jgi:hypothetical protein
VAAELLQGPGERRAGPEVDAAVPPDPDGRGEQQARLQDEQRLLEPGARPAPEHGPQPVQLEPELAGAAAIHQLHPGALALPAEQQQPEPRRHAGGAGAADAAEPAEPAAKPAGPAGTEQRTAKPAAAAAATAAKPKPAAAATARQPQLALASGTGARPRLGSGPGAAAARPHVPAAPAHQRTELAGQNGGETGQRLAGRSCTILCMAPFLRFWFWFFGTTTVGGDGG